MYDRLPTYPGRVTLTPVPGQENTYDMVMADDPTQVGTPPTKANLLSDETAAIIWKNPNGAETVSEALGEVGAGVPALKDGSGEKYKPVFVEIPNTIDNYVVNEGYFYSPDLTLKFTITDKSNTGFTLNCYDFATNDLKYSKPILVSAGARSRVWLNPTLVSDTQIFMRSSEVSNAGTNAIINYTDEDAALYDSRENMQATLGFKNGSRYTWFCDGEISNDFVQTNPRYASPGLQFCNISTLETFSARYTGLPINSNNINNMYLKDDNSFYAYFNYQNQRTLIVVSGILAQDSDIEVNTLFNIVLTNPPSDANNSGNSNTINGIHYDGEYLYIVYKDDIGDGDEFFLTKRTLDGSEVYTANLGSRTLGYLTWTDGLMIYQTFVVKLEDGSVVSNTLLNAFPTIYVTGGAYQLQANSLASQNWVREGSPNIGFRLVTSEVIVTTFDYKKAYYSYFLESGTD